ncbi:hypothetical protein LTR22_027504 [Elasticomyces elasticus]|nr:hypothetical protein LTR22_027504 [Elasticomyces elasticus]
MSGWESDFVSFNLGIVLLTWGFVGFDAAVHISEETRKARWAIPRSMFWPICMNAAMGFGMVMIFLYTMGDVEEFSASPYPLLMICINAPVLSPAPPLCLHRIPLRAVWLPVFVVMVLSLLNLAGATAFSVILALSTFGLCQSYIIAIACMLHARLTGRVQTAQWSLGRFGVPINIVALVYSAWLAIFMVFPNYLPITALNMNYALPINAAVWIVALITWFVYASKKWKGLNIALSEKIVADGDRDTKD